MKKLMLDPGTVFMLSVAFVATQDCCPQGVCDTEVCCAGQTACCSLD